MFLRHLHLENIRSIEKLDLSFNAQQAARNWTYLLGENGTGKSSILKAIGLVLAGSESIFELVGNPDDWIRLGMEEASIALEFSTQDGEMRHASVTFKRGSGTSQFVRTNGEALDQIDRAIFR